MNEERLNNDEFKSYFYDLGYETDVKLTEELTNKFLDMMDINLIEKYLRNKKIIKIIQELKNE